MEKRSEKGNQEALDKVPQWIERGNKLIYPERQAEWANCVNKRARGIYRGYEVEATLEIMEKLEEDSDMKVAKRALLNQGHRRSSFGLVSRMIFEFSKKGPEFYEMITPVTEIDKETQEVIDQKKNKNKMLMEKI